MPEKVDLLAAFNMTPADAVSYFRAKGYAFSDSWQEVWQGAHANAFTVAKALRSDVLEMIREEVDRSIAQGMSPEEFERRLTPKLKDAGWWGKQTWTDEFGNEQQVQLGSPWRLRTIYNTNHATAFAAGSYRRMVASARFRPYWRYMAIRDDRTRPGHFALNGKVFRWDDPIWEYIFPPNDWGCRCNVRSLSERNLQSLGVEVEDGASYIERFKAEAGVSKTTGEVFTTDHVKINLPDGQVMSPGIGWAYNPGSAAFGTDMAIARKLGTVQSTEVRSQLIQSLNNSELRQQRFGDWAEQVLSQRQAGHQVQALGFMPEEVSQAVLKRFGNEPSRLLAINEKSLVHADSVKHQAEDVALTLDEYKRLPAMINNPEAVLWEDAGQALLITYPADDGRSIKLVIRPLHKLKKQADLLDVLVNVFKVPKRALKSAQYEVLQGEIGAP